MAASVGATLLEGHGGSLAILVFTQITTTDDLPSRARTCAATVSTSARTNSWPWSPDGGSARLRR